MAKFDMSKIEWKKVVTVGAMIAAAIVGAVSDYKEKQEMEDLKKTVKALKSMGGDS